MEFSDDVIQRLKLLEEKYNAMGQDLLSYLDGLLYADYVTYWDYIGLDTLLSLQKPRTPFPDETVFIMYHQVNELFFKLSLHELKQIAEKENADVEFLVARINRVNRYFEALTHSFGIMVDGMEHEQFLKFRMALLPASGFQSAQYRMVEIYATDFIRLVDKEIREEYESKPDTPISEMFSHIYWKAGATELATGKKTLTLKQFEIKYSGQLIRLAEECKSRNLWAIYKRLPEKDQQNEAMIVALRQFDVNVNINWPLVHYKSAVRYLQRDPVQVAATGGTNWQKYLPPRFQKRIFYPALWTQDEIEHWGKSWVESVIRHQEGKS